jgi:hypothetical protein
MDEIYRIHLPNNLELVVLKHRKIRHIPLDGFYLQAMVSSCQVVVLSSTSGEFLLSLLIPTTFHSRLSFCSALPSEFTSPSWCRVGEGAQYSELASIRRSNPACRFPALGFHKSTLSAQRIDQFDMANPHAYRGASAVCFQRHWLLGFSQKKLIHVNIFIRITVASFQLPLPAAFPSPRCYLHEVIPFSRHFKYYSALRPLVGHRFPFRSSLIRSLILTPLRNPMNSPGVTHCSSASCCPHTSWFDG